ncbi:MAG TPA: DMT family transporter [Bacillota bacterium]|nr:DMT family transporter [Bacillota bacterium]
MKKTNMSLLAKLAMFAATLIWGSSFMIVKDVTDSVPVFFLLAVRFITSSVLLAAVFCKSMKKINAQYLWQGAVLGILMFAAYALQTFGITYTTPGKNAFLTAVYCVIVPFLYWAIGKNRPDRFNVVSALMCLAGIGLVSLSSELSVGAGDMLTLGGGVFFALHIVCVAKFSADKDPVTLTAVQFLATGIASLLCCACFEDVSANMFDSGILWQMAYLTFFCTAAALLLQNFGQKYTHPASASLILSLESVFGVIFSIAFGRESLDVKTAVGFAVIFAAIIVSETKLSFIIPKKK